MRSRYVLGIVVALCCVAPAAAAIGPGGWDHVGVGATSHAASLNGAVYAMNTQNPGLLYAGGNFTTAGGNSKASRIAKWNGTSWGAIGATPLTNGAVFAIAYNAGRVFAGGTFVNAGGDADADFLAMWDGSTWSPFCTSAVPGPPITGNVNALQIVGNTLYVGGSFQNGGGLAAADYLLACDLTTGVSRSTVPNDGNISGSVYALTADTNGTLYAGGGFINVEGILAADHVAAYDGVTWHAMGSGAGPGGGAVDSFVRGLTASGTNVYIGTDSVDVAGIAQADHVARWTGSAWSAVGSGTGGTNGWFPATTFINSMTVYGPNIIAAGSFQNADGIASADNIAYFDGSQWRPIGSDGAGNGPFIGNATSLGLFAGKIYVGGNFTRAGGDTFAVSIAAYAVRLPDALIASSTAGPWYGNNVYSPTAVGEIRPITIPRGGRATFYLRFQNDGITSAAFSLRSSGGAGGFSTFYYRNGVNVTSAVHAGTYSTGAIAPRSYITMGLIIVVARTSAASVSLGTTANSQYLTPPDTVGVAARAG